jgi:hypothetical protein
MIAVRGDCIFSGGYGKLFVRLDRRTEKEELVNRESEDESDEYRKKEEILCTK